MSNIRQWLIDLASLPQMDMNNWKPYRYEYQVSYLEFNQLPEALSVLGNITGYLTTTSEVFVFNQKTISFSDYPLSGEFYSSGNHWIITYDANGRWSLHAYKLENCENEIEKANCLCEQVTHLRTSLPDDRTGSKHKKTLKYHRLWEPANTILDANAPVCRIALLNQIEF